MKFWEFKAAANGKDHELMVYGDIAEWWGVDSKEFNTQLNAIEADNINVRINSYGGEVLPHRQFILDYAATRHISQFTLMVLPPAPRH